MNNSTLSLAYCKTMRIIQFVSKKTATPKPASLSHQIKNKTQNNTGFKLTDIHHRELQN